MKAIRIQGLRKTYSNQSVAIDGVDLSVESGDFFALLGPNGAGKTTLIGIITSLVKKTSGKVWVYGRDIDVAPEAARSFIGVVPQEFNFSLFERVDQTLLQQAGYYGLPRKLAKVRTEKYLKKLGLWDRRGQQVRTLSGGLKRRLMIARAMVNEPQLLILDEPTAGVDISMRRSMWAFLQEINRSGTTIVLTTHYLEEAESLCRHIAIIDHGRLIEYTKTSDLVRRLSQETFVLNLETGLARAPEIKDFSSRLIDPVTLEVDVREEQTINAMYKALSAQKIIVSSMKNKSNRLEEVLLRLINKP